VNIAVLVKCCEHHKVAEFSPFPATGEMTKVAVKRFPARYHSVVAG
jgi:hypothetical protein